MRKLFFSVAFLLVATSTGFAGYKWFTDNQYGEADLTVGKQRFESYCISCHGDKGQGGLGPKVSGQTYDYIFGRLTTYKNRGKVGSQSNMMWSQASALSDQDIVDVSKYITEQLK